MLFRLGEKEILHYLLDAAEKVNQLASLNVKDARKELNKGGTDRYKGMMDYLKNVILGTLQNKDTQNN